MIDRQPVSSELETSTATLQEQAYDYVKAGIMNLDLKPAAYITDTQVAGELNISRTPVREALRRLEHEGLLVNLARRGWRVYTLSLQDIHEIFDLKAAIEGLVARQAAACENEQLRAALQAAMAHMQQAAANRDGDAWHRADTDLHRILFAMGGNERARRIIQNLNDQWHRVRVGFLAVQGRIERSNPEHKAVVDSILAHDGDEAERLMREHLNFVREELVRLLANMVLPFVQDGV